MKTGSLMALLQNVKIWLLVSKNFASIESEFYAVKYRRQYLKKINRERNITLEIDKRFHRDLAPI